MELMEAITSRRSVRSFEDRKIEDEKIGMILDACRWAPSAGNKQPWNVIVVDDKEKISKISEISLDQNWVKGVPLLMAIAANHKLGNYQFGDRDTTLYSVQSTAAAAQNMMLVATSLGLGTCWVDPVNEDEVAKVLDCPSYVKPLVILAVGYPKPPKPKVPSRYEIYNFSFYNKHGTVKKDVWKGFRKTTKELSEKLLKSLKKY